MQNMLPRTLERTIKKAIKTFPAVLVTGPLAQAPGYLPTLTRELGLGVTVLPGASQPANVESAVAVACAAWPLEAS